MKKMSIERCLFVVLTIAGFVCSWAALPARADEWSKTYTLTGKPDLRVDTSDANIHVSTWDQNTIEAKVTTTRYKIGDDGIRIEEHQSGDTVEIDVRYPHLGVTINWGNSMSHRVEIDIHMPREGRVDLHTGDGKIDLGNFKGEMQLRSGDGSQEIDGVDGKLHATTGMATSAPMAALTNSNSRQRWPHGCAGHGRVNPNHGLEARKWRWHSHTEGAGKSVRRRGSAHRRRPHRSRHAGHDRRQDSRKRSSRQAERRRNLLVIHTGDGSIRLRKG